MVVHQIYRGQKTTLYPLAMSDLDKGSIAKNAKVLEDLLLDQLNVPKENIAQLLTIVGGNQLIVDKLCVLKKFLKMCLHESLCYGWILPLIKLWYIGWADLERVLNTH